jgi:hypothetical protein
LDRAAVVSWVSVGVHLPAQPTPLVTIRLKTDPHKNAAFAE